MRIRWVTALAVVVILAGCDRVAPVGDGGVGHGGRFFGVGVFDADQLWSRMVTPRRSTDAALATTADDAHVIVVVDSRTGELRECGDHSGYCVAMNPWTKPLAGEQRLPVRVTEHLAEVAEQAKETTMANNTGD